VNAPAKIKPSRDRYIPIVKHHLPHCKDGDEMMLRCSILLLRDQAAAGLRRCSEEAYGILSEVQRLGLIYAFASIPTEELEALRYRLVMLTACASGLEMFAYRLANPNGGTDARG
jgi:hypothetical protein